MLTSKGKAFENFEIEFFKLNIDILHLKILMEVVIDLHQLLQCRFRSNSAF